MSSNFRTLVFELCYIEDVNRHAGIFERTWQHCFLRNNFLSCHRENVSKTLASEVFLLEEKSWIFGYFYLIVTRFFELLALINLFSLCSD